jgi:acyl carrier protein
VKERLARYISEELLNLTGDGRERTIAADEDLLGGGLVDSLGMMSLVYFIEQELGIDVPAEDVTIENFQTLEAIDAYLARRRAQP